MATPMQEQYDNLKKKHEDSILLFRLGDFYEAFDNDAKIISKVLSIVLTGRGKGENRRPMAGIPHHALDNYLPKLVNAGYKVAIAEQLEEPQKGKTIVERGVIKVTSAGTITSEKSLDENKNNYIASICSHKEKRGLLWGISYCDLTTGEFLISEFYSSDNSFPDQLIIELMRIHPSELLVEDKIIPEIKKELQDIRFQPLKDYDFNFQENENVLKKHFKVKTLKGFGVSGFRSGISAAGALLQYLIETQKAPLEHINKISYKHTSEFMWLDDSTIRSLELVQSIRSDTNSSLLNVIDHCQTSIGKRKLYQWLLHPLLSSNKINNRLKAVREFYKNPRLLKAVRTDLDTIFDMERILGRLGTQTINARDLLALKQSLESSVSISKKLVGVKADLNKDVMKKLKNREVDPIIDLISKSIEEDPPVTITEGGIIRDGYNKKLDKIKGSSRGGKEWLTELQTREVQKTGIHSLKIKFNKVFGYYIEVSKSNLHKVPENYIRKQTLVNAERFITPELKEKEDLILSADEKIIELEYELFKEIRERISKSIKVLQEIAEAVSVLDCITNFAFIAREFVYTEPKLVKNPENKLNIVAGRHPVVEVQNEEKFISNDTSLDCNKNQLAIVTGPNMAGKSTYIRQVALIVLMAQVGSFVPAKKMEFSPVDRIFTRIGASDNISSGESTFLVEMNETANILNNATKNSLIILDEVGRGTSTYDGVAIAWAVAEYIHNNIGAKTLFATHYHELVDLEKYLKRVVNLNVAVNESDGKIIFLRKIKAGGTDKSYGVHVAKFAGIPEKIIEKANQILMGLEQEGMFEVKHVESEITSKNKRTSQIPLLTSLPESPAVKKLKKIDINSLTPLNALEILDELKKLIKDHN